MDGRVHVVEIPFVGWNLAAGVLEADAEEQIELLFGKVGIDHDQRDGMEGQVPGCVPGVLPLVGHRDDVGVHHVEPLAIAHAVQRIGLPGVAVLLRQPLVQVVVVKLLRPQHAGQRLAHDVGRVGGQLGRRNGGVERVRLGLALRHFRLESASQRRGRIPPWPFSHEPQPNLGRLARLHRQLVMGGGLRALLGRVDCRLHAADHVIVEAILDVGGHVRLVPGALLVGFVIGKQQRGLGTAKKIKCTQCRVGGHHCLQAGRTVGGAHARPLRLRQRRPCVAEPECG